MPPAPAAVAPAVPMPPAPAPPGVPAVPLLPAPLPAVPLSSPEVGAQAPPARMTAVTPSAMTKLQPWLFMVFHMYQQ